MAATLATQKGRVHAIDELHRRRERSSQYEKIDNAASPAGSPMYYYCIGCGDVAEVMPELHSRPPRQLCEECQALKDLGWLTE